MINRWSSVGCLLMLVGLALGQTFEINNPSSPAPSGDGKHNRTGARAAGAGAQSLGWGSSIEVARQARAAQDALKRGDYRAAADYAEQAAKSAPQNTDLWFLLGYAARLAGRYPASVEAYQRGLQNQPDSSKGLAGLAQTFTKMGRDEEARQLLLRVVKNNPKDATSLELAGELFLNSDPKRALELLRAAETQEPSAHTELLIARAYQRLGQSDQAGQFLARAKGRAPHDPEVLRAVAGEYRDSGQYDQAIATLQAVPTKTTDVLAELAYTYELAGKKQQAANLYTQVARAARGNIGLELSAAQALVNLGESEAARGFLENARQLNRDHYRLHAILGQIAESEDRLPDAIREYQLAIDHLPGSTAEGPLYPIQLRLNLYELYQQNGDQSDAKQQLSLAAAAIGQAHVAGTSRPEFLRLRAAIESASGNLDAADKDLKEALALAPSNVNSLLNYATLLWKLGQKDTARGIFEKILTLDHHNRLALTSLGYLAREMGDTKQAETYFKQAVHLYPKEFAPRVALGDLYASEREFPAAQANYEAAYQRMPGNALILAGGANAALEAHRLDLAKRWLDRATGPLNQSPQVMRERQRYLTWKGEYQQAADLGYKVLAQLPRDRQAPVYLAYDLYNLGRYQDAFDLATRYETILPDNKDFALIEGYVHVRSGQSQEALRDFTRALELDPLMATGYANRGFVFNDLRRADAATKDFQMALHLKPDYPEAHLGLAYAYLQLHRSPAALEQLSAAEKSLGKTRPWHLARAEAFRQEQKLSGAEQEYRAALEQEPNDLTTQLALADNLFRMRRYNDSINALNAALKLSPGNPAVYAQLALAYAKLGQQEAALRYVQAAEQYGKSQASILMTTGNALLALGEREAAMQRFSHALEEPEGNSVGTRLAIAQIFVREGRWDDARRQIALGLAEARVGDAPPVTADDLVEAANILLAIHDFDLAKTYFQKAQLAGANQRVVALGLANTYLAAGDSHAAETELASLGNPSDYKDDYDYTMAKANLYRARQDTAHALSAFARAGTLAGQDDTDALQSAQYELAGEEGRQINQTLSLSSAASFAPVLEDINIYTLDARLGGITNPNLLPPPRHSFQSLGQEHYRVHVNGLPAITGFVGESMTSGRFSFPSNDVIQDRNTYDTVLNGGLSPVLHLGSNTLAFNTGLQFTIRRDTITPADLNQNLFRQFLYLSTSSFFNWVSVSGSAIREAGPFTEQNLHSRDASANLEFNVGRPWGHTSLIAGYSARDLLFRPAIREYFTTSTYVGLQHKLGNRFTAALVGDYLRSWRVQDNRYAIAQAIVPGARFEYRANPRWTVQGSFTLSRGEGFHAYDNAQSEFLVSYLRPVRRSFEAGNERTSVFYPFQFSFGLQQQTFYDFAGRNQTTLLPVVHFTLF